MKFFLLIECENTVKNPLVCDYDNLEQFNYDELNFVTGNRVDSWNDNIFLQAKKKKNDGNLDDALQNHLMLPIYSPRLIIALSNLGVEGIQFLPVRILRPNNDCIDGYCVANILNFIEALDYEKSDYNRFSEDFPNPNARGKIAGILKYVLKEEKLRGFDIVRLKDYKRSIFVSEKVKEAFEKNKLTGYSFRQVTLI